MLTLPIKKKWFDMILSGEKKEEYRQLNDYYRIRFCNLFPGFEDSFVDPKIGAKPIVFRNGYRKDSPSFTALCSFRIGTGKEEWGAEKDKQYFVLTIHEILRGSD